MRRAVTLLELILVIVIIGILAKIGLGMIRTHPLLDDAQWIALQIRQTQYRGIGYDHRAFGGGEIDQEATVGCLTLDRESLDSNASQGEAHYRIRSQLSGELAGKELCFDHRGRPSLNDTPDHNHSNYLITPQSLILSDRDRNLTLELLPLSGCVIILH
jgi:prepilin-type N-terminal cleavage/methylation domain-containing protein